MIPLRGAAIAGICVLATACGPGPEARHAERLRALLASTPAFIEPGPRGRASWEQTRAFYEGRDHRPAWIDGQRPTAQLDDLLKALSLADAHGLEPADYRVAPLADARRAADQDWWRPRFEELQVAPLDAQLTYAFLQLAADLLNGRVAPRRVDDHWVPARDDEDLANRLREAIASNRVGQALDALAPSHAQYKGLQQALVQYRQLARTGQRLRNDKASAAWRVQQIEMALDRWRWMPRDLGERHIVVNVAAYELQVVEHDRPVLAMRVVVGAPNTPTPLFSDQMSYVAFSPVLEHSGDDPPRGDAASPGAGSRYLSRAGIEVVRASGPTVDRVDPATVDLSQDPAAQGLRFRQVPGPENALGLVKFIFPNHFNVYLHDTPAVGLFKRARRALSHGCVRVEQPLALAESVLNDQPSWTRARIAAAMRTPQEEVARLRHPIPVHLGYWTVWVQGDGRLAFTDDPYGIDRRHARARKSATLQAKKAQGPDAGGDEVSAVRLARIQQPDNPLALK